MKHGSGGLGLELASEVAIAFNPTRGHHFFPANGAFYLSRHRQFVPSLHISCKSFQDRSHGGKDGDDFSRKRDDYFCNMKGGDINSLPLNNTSLQPLSQDMAMGLVLHAAGGTGWTTDSGLEGPSMTSKDESGEATRLNWPWLSKSPRRRLRVAFTCNVCGERTTRAINPHAYTDGTVFVQCSGCDVFHKLVDNLNLYQEFNYLYKPSDKLRYADPELYKFVDFYDLPPQPPPS